MWGKPTWGRQVNQHGQDGPPPKGQSTQQRSARREYAGLWKMKASSNTETEPLLVHVQDRCDLVTRENALSGQSARK
jgi:hypothetical protein